MKKRGFHLLLVITLLFGAFTLGLLLGRNSRSGAVTVAVPSEMLTEPPATTTEAATEGTSPAVVFPIDLNKATREELMELPGIGYVLAGRIIDFRDEIDGFTAVEDLLKVEGIGEKRFEEIMEKITIGG